MKTKLNITCPECAHSFNLDSALVNHFHQSVKKELQSELRQREEELKKQKDEFKALSKQLEKDKEDYDSMVDKRVKELISTKESELKKSIRNEIQEEKEKQLSELENELMKKSKQLVELNQTKAKLKRLSREFEEKEANIQLKMEEKLNDKLAEMKSNMKEQLESESLLKIKAKEDVIQSLQQKLKEAQQRASQGSMQSQGEASEIALEELLQELNPTDEISEIKKGARGADCIQKVITQSGKVAGEILYESKNTKNWSDKFIKKLKQDNLDTKADLMVIVTKTMPKDATSKFVLIEGVWVTQFHNVKDLSLMLRYGLLKTFSVIQKQSGKEDKMSLLYDYLTSNEFKATFESILDGFKSLQESHNEEQRKIQLLWKKREKHLQQVLASTIDFYGSLKGISGDSVPDIKMLDFPQAG